MPVGPALASPFESHRMNRRQIQRYRLPRVSGVLAHPQRSGRRTEREYVAAVVYVEGVAVHEVVGVPLRQPVGQRLERLPPIPRTIHDDATVGGISLFVLYRGDKPGGVRIAWMHGDGKSKGGRKHIGDLA